MTAPEPPVTKYELTVKIRGNTHDEIEDHTPWLNQGPKNNQNFLGIEGSWRTHD